MPRLERTVGCVSRDGPWGIRRRRAKGGMMFRQAHAYTAITAAAIAAVAMAAPAAAAPLPATPAVTPGAAIGVYDSSGKAAGTCTLGFLATGNDGTHYAFTAGHCDHSGPVLTPYQAEGNFQRIGQPAVSVQESTWPDIAAIKLDGTLPLDTRVLSRRPVTGVTSTLRDGDTLCYYGMRSGRQCGAAFVSTMDADSVSFAATAGPGDSGAPVYRIEKDGSATAVGILKGGSDQLGASATLIQPFLTKWGLTLDTTPRVPAPARAPALPRARALRPPRAADRIGERRGGVPAQPARAGAAGAPSPRTSPATESSHRRPRQAHGARSARQGRAQRASA